MRKLADYSSDHRQIGIAAYLSTLVARLAAIFVWVVAMSSCTSARYAEVRRLIAQDEYVIAAERLAADGELDAQGWALLAEARLAAGEYIGVVSAARESIKRSGQYAPRVTHHVRQAFVAQLVAATAAYEVGQYAEVVTQFGQLSVFAAQAGEFLQPDQLTALTHASALAASLAVRLKDYPNARAHLEVVELTWQHDPALLAQLAMIYDQMGEAQACAETCEAALVLEPGNRELLELRAQAYRKQGQTAAAIAAYKSALERLPNSTLLQRNLGIIFYDLEDWGQASSYLAAAAGSSADSLDLLELLAECFYHAGRGDEAIACYARLVSARPSDPVNYRGLGACHYMVANPHAADSLLAIARDLEAQQPATVQDSSRKETGAAVQPKAGGPR